MDVIDKTEIKASRYRVGSSRLSESVALMRFETILSDPALVKRERFSFNMMQKEHYEKLPLSEREFHKYLLSQFKLEELRVLGEVGRKQRRLEQLRSILQQPENIKIAHEHYEYIEKLIGGSRSMTAEDYAFTISREYEALSVGKGQLDQRITRAEVVDSETETQPISDAQLADALKDAKKGRSVGHTKKSAGVGR